MPVSPYLPLTPDEIAQNAIDAARAGAAAVHVHARNPENGMPSPDMNIFGEIIEKIKEDLEKVCSIMRKNGTKPELEIYDVSHLYNAAFLASRGFLDPPIYMQFVMGILGGINATIYDLVHLKQTADRLFGAGNYIWSAFGAGRMEFPICTTAVILSGHCRVGMEDALKEDPGN